MQTQDASRGGNGPAETSPGTQRRPASYRTVRLALRLVLHIGLLHIAIAPKPEASARSMEPLAEASRLWFVENRGQLAEEVLFYSLGGPVHLWLTEDALWYSNILASQPDEQPKTAEANNLGTRLNVRLRFLQPSESLEVTPLNRQNLTYSVYRGNENLEQAERLPVWGGLRIEFQVPAMDLVIQDQNGRLQLSLFANDEHTVPLFGLEGVTLLERGPSIGGPAIGRAQTAAGAPPSANRFDDIVEIPLPEADFPYLLRLQGPDGLHKDHWIRPSSGVISGADEANVSGAVSYSTFIGGTLWDEAEAIAVDSQSRIYLGGHTQSLDFPSGPGQTALEHNVDAFIVRLNAGTGNFFTVLQGSDLQNGEEYTSAITLDSFEQVIATGRTDSIDFPTTAGAYDTTFNGGIDGFVFRLNFDGTLAYSTLLGGADTDWPTSVSADANSIAHLSGGTWSAAFPTTAGAYDAVHNGARDIFYAQIAPAGDALLYSTFIGGGSQEQSEDIALAGGDVYLTGWTRSSDFPVHVGAFQTSLGGDFDAFALQFNPLTSSLVVSTYLGGQDEDRAFGIVVLPAGEILVSGQTSSGSFPLSPGSFDMTFGGGACGISACPDGFVASLSPDGSQLSYGSFLGGSGSDKAFDVGATPGGSIYITGETESHDFPLSLTAFSRFLAGGRDVFVMAFEPGFNTLGFSSYLGGSDSENGSAIAISPAEKIFIAGKTRSADFPVSPNAYDPVINGDYDAFAISLDLEVLTLHLLPIALRQSQ